MDKQQQEQALGERMDAHFDAWKRDELDQRNGNATERFLRDWEEGFAAFPLADDREFRAQVAPLLRTIVAKFRSGLQRDRDYATWFVQNSKRQRNPK